MRRRIVQLLHWLLDQMHEEPHGSDHFAERVEFVSPDGAVLYGPAFMFDTDLLLARGWLKLPPTLPHQRAALDRLLRGGDIPPYPGDRSWVKDLIPLQRPDDDGKP